MVIEKIVNTLNKIGSKFGSARDLVEAIEEFGLFSGKAFNKEGWGLDYTADIPVPYAYAEQGWVWPEFGAFTKDGIWYCCLGYGVHSLILGFDERNGELVHIEPDESPSNRCWAAASFEGRVDEVLNLLGIIWFPSKIPKEKEDLKIEMPIIE